jgi:hypothetical protein
MLQARSAKPRKNGQKEMAVTGKNRIMIYGPKDDGTYIIEFKTAAGEAIPATPKSAPSLVGRLLGCFQPVMRFARLLAPRGYGHHGAG